MYIGVVVDMFIMDVHWCCCIYVYYGCTCVVVDMGVHVLFKLWVYKCCCRYGCTSVVVDMGVQVLL